MTASCVSTREVDEIEIGATSGALIDPAIDAAIDAAFVTAMDPISRRAPSGLPCQVRDADLWFAEAPADLEIAKSLCELCPARTACLLGALERREPCGVWGGQIFARGAIVEHKRPRGRPRKLDREIAA